MRILSILLLVASSQSVQAESDWKGAYAGGSVGFGQLTTSSRRIYSLVETGGLATSSAFGDTQYSHRGEWDPSLGVFIGWNLKLGDFVIGPQLEIARMSSSAKYDDGRPSCEALRGLANPAEAASIPCGYALVRHTWNASILARAGYLLNDDALLYLIGGYTRGWFRDGPVNSRNGLTIGGGLELLLSGPWSLRVEYRETDFGKWTGGFNRNGSSSPSTSFSESLSEMFDASVREFKASVTIAFD